MTQFKTKKIKTDSKKIPVKYQKKPQHNPKKSVPKSQKTLRRIAGGILIIALLIFGIQIGLQAIGNQHFSKNDEYKLFKPISIDFGGKKENTGPKGTKNILLAGIG